MTRPATDRLKVNKPVGLMPSLQYLPPELLHIDAVYQRSLDTAPSQTLVRQIAQHWNWNLCQPLVVSRRNDGALYVIDGQHRLAAARMRGDIAQLPAVVVQYSDIQDEAANFVHLNQQRQPLTKIDLFKAAIASGDAEACGIVAAIEAAGLRLAPHTNYTAWKPGMVANIGGIETCWRRRGKHVTGLALKALSEGIPGDVLRYAGTIFPGIARVCALESDNGQSAITPEKWTALTRMIGSRSQVEWRGAIMTMRAADQNLSLMRASEVVFLRAWDDAWAAAVSREKASIRAETPAATAAAPAHRDASPNPPPLAPAVAAAPAVQVDRSVRTMRPVVPARLLPAKTGAAKPTFGKMGLDKAWCEQCDQRRTRMEAGRCQDRHCPLRSAAS